ncbi:uncharacterized protein BKA55DRAFT_675442 [Fusarium redolens]|uniref:Uncharacterized protein n=1 Tax=Fusarium redolens TaxID=48865 RepID=A0A9P9HBJ5_FUSRE|nr:uncharacterized protein BKA55DRAFT_675442 [Fusarium redolens]KAH7254270.1 hypothetical protein BKA55DRAFT_675442 [Fusarium redolens]
MPSGDASTPQNVPELKAIGIASGGVLYGVRFESPSGETGNMVAPSDITENAIIYQGGNAGERRAIETSNLRRPDGGMLCSITIPITSKGRMDSELPAGYRKIEMKLSFAEESETNAQSMGAMEIAKCEEEKATVCFTSDDWIPFARGRKALMLEEVVDGGEGTGGLSLLVTTGHGGESDDDIRIPDEGQAPESSTEVGASDSIINSNDSSSVGSTSEGESNAASQPVLTIPSTPRIVRIHQVGELRLIGILDPLNRGVGFYFENAYEGILVRNVMANVNLAVQALIFQGERGAGNHVARKLPGLYPNQGLRVFSFKPPFRVACPALRHLRLPLGFRRCFFGLRPKGTIVHKLARDAECSPREVRRYNRIWQAWKQENGALPKWECDVALIAWPAMAYCAGGMSLEFVQELEADSLGGTEVVM